MVFAASNKEHAIPLFTNLNVLPLNMIYYKSVCNLLYDVSNSSCPTIFSDYFNHTHKTTLQKMMCKFTQDSE